MGEDDGEQYDRPESDNDGDVAFLDDTVLMSEFLQDNVLLLRESDIPGASLNGKNPSELNMTQLKRWLACHGAPTTGRKSELVERYSVYDFMTNRYYFFNRVMCYIKYGWDKLLVDPDNGKNCCRKLATSHIPDSMSMNLFQSIPVHKIWNGQADCIMYQRLPSALFLII